MEQSWALGEKVPVWAWLSLDQLAKGHLKQEAGDGNQISELMERAHVPTQCNKTKKKKSLKSNSSCLH